MPGWNGILLKINKQAAMWAKVGSDGVDAEMNPSNVCYFLFGNFC